MPTRRLRDAHAMPKRRLRDAYAMPTRCQRLNAHVQLLLHLRRVDTRVPQPLTTKANTIRYVDVYVFAGVRGSTNLLHSITPTGLHIFACPQ